MVETAPTPITPTPAAAQKTPLAPKPSSPGFKIPSMFPRRASARRSNSVDSVTTANIAAAPTHTITTTSSSILTPSGTGLGLGSSSLGALTAPSSGTSTPITPGAAPGVIPRPASAQQTQTQKSKFRKSWGAKSKDYNFSAANDIMGIVMLEIQGARDLPKLKNSASSFLSVSLCCVWV